LFLHRPEPLAEVTLAGILSRSGAGDEAWAVCARHPNDANLIVTNAAAALRARLLLARGAIEEAETALRNASPTAAVLEARASIALSRRDTASARELLLEAESAPGDAEQRARVAALLAHLEHQEGNHDAALEGYTRAANDAARAGAIV